MGKGEAFDQALASFSVAYADQNEKDHAALKRAIRSERPSHDRNDDFAEALAALEAAEAALGLGEGQDLTGRCDE